MVKVLIVDDSRVVRDYLVYIVGNHPTFQVIDTATDGEEALASIRKQRPDVILMDIHMPKLDGLEVTRRVMSSPHPIPIVICTASIYFGAVHTAMHALEAGALAVLRKPSGLSDPHAEEEGAAILNALKLMSEVKVVRRWRTRTPLPMTAPNGAPVSKPYPPHDRIQSPDRPDIVVIGASTGGPAAILQILAALPATFPVPILVVQHIAVGFTDGFADWLASSSRLPVHVARNGDLPRAGHIYVAPDDHHLRIDRHSKLHITQEAHCHGSRPSVGVLFRSVADHFGHRAVGILLTGMGRDGAEELKILSDRGAITIVQDEESCVVFGMPGEAIKRGAARYVCPPDEIAHLLLSNIFSIKN